MAFRIFFVSVALATVAFACLPRRPAAAGESRQGSTQTEAAPQNGPAAEPDSAEPKTLEDVLRLVRRCRPKCE